MCITSKILQIGHVVYLKRWSGKGIKKIKHFLKNTVIGLALIAIGASILYFFFIVDYLEMLSGQKEYFKYSLRIFLVPAIIIYAISILFLQPNHQILAPYNLLEAGSPARIFHFWTIAVCVFICSVFFGWSLGALKPANPALRTNSNSITTKQSNQLNQLIIARMRETLKKQKLFRYYDRRHNK
jgi:hypothetical protein